MPDFEPPPEARELVLAPDHDEAGLKAIDKASARVGVRFRQLLPPEGMDWCDVLENHEERIAIQEEPEALQSWVKEFCNGV